MEERRHGRVVGDTSTDGEGREKGEARIEIQRNGREIWVDNDMEGNERHTDATSTSTTPQLNPTPNPRLPTHYVRFNL